jgi:hypothetical protein
VLNNVNANAQSLTPMYIDKAAALADVFRPYGIKVYLSARFSAPIEIGKLKTADPCRSGGAAWWKAKADEIYAASPISAASWSRPIRRASPVRRTMAAATPTAPTCWPTRWRRTAAS